jgi:AcrR family transcriptional regulator
MSEFRNKRKELEYQLRREFIIEVAQKLFYKHGYENVTLNEVAKKADYTKATLYSYIKSKEDLYMEVYSIGLHQRYEYLQNEMAKAESGLAKIEMFGRAYYEFYKNHSEILYHQQYLDYRPINPEKIDPNLMERFQKVNVDGYMIVVDAIKDGIADNTIKEDLDPNYLYSQIIYALRAVASAAVYRRKSVLKEDNTEEINRKWYYSFLELLINAIAKK